MTTTTTANGPIRVREVTPTFRHTKHLAAFTPSAKVKGESEADKIAASLVRAQVYAKADNRKAINAMHDSCALRYNMLHDCNARGQANATDMQLANVYGSLCSYLRSL